MAERPILFSGEMVRAILSGAKVQTRRAIRGLPPDPQNVRFLGMYLKCDAPPGSGAVSLRIWCPYGERGDRLWVRETWKSSEYRCSDEAQEDGHECGAHCFQKYVYYAATPRVGYRAVPDRERIVYLDSSTPLTEWHARGWRPSIRMPRWASRITLEITDVRVQRLQEISEEDARAEGVDALDGALDAVELCRVAKLIGGCPEDARTWFAVLWDSINGKRPGCSWDANPWVWVVSFRRVQPEAHDARFTGARP